MPLSIADLKAAINTPDPLLEVSPDFLQLDQAAELFTRFFPDALLRVDKKSVDDEALVIEGSVPIVGQDPSDARVAFLADRGGEYLEGIRIDVLLLPDGPGLPAELAGIPAALARLGLGPLHQVLGIEPDGGARVGLGIELLFPKRDTNPRPYVWAYPPTEEGETWNFFGAFDDVPLSGLDDLREISDGSFALPVNIGTGDLTLNSLAFDVIPADAASGGEGQWLTLGIGLKLAGRWEALPGVLELENLDAAFTVTTPLDQPKVSAVLGGRVELADEIQVDVTVMLPRMSIQGNLANRLEVGTVLKQMFGDIPLLGSLAVSRLIVSAEMGSNPDYALDLTLDSDLMVVEGLKLSKVSLRVAKEAGKVTASIDADWQLGDGAVFDVVGTWTSGGSWIFTATTDAPGIALTDVMVLFDHEAPDVPDVLNPRLVRLEFGYEPTGGALVVQASTGKFSMAFVSLPQSLSGRSLDRQAGMLS
ncbi:hypothetical protein [Streptomyces sp. x-80]|uniref:hypothetical protein n=1 Tax=Streptomyces sp. x-80 TaxID=2789282 RepID=UPI00397FA049